MTEGDLAVLPARGTGDQRRLEEILETAPAQIGSRRAPLLLDVRVDQPA